jgi:hypothetical protein
MNSIDCLDLGCGTGGSIAFAKQEFGGSEFLGITDREAEAERADGYSVIVGDMAKIDFPACRYVTALHSFEHLPSYDVFCSVLKRAVNAASEFVYFVVPNFDSDDELAKAGLKLAWSYYTGHTLKLTQALIHKALLPLNLPYTLTAYGEVLNSYHNEVLPLSAPVDTVYYSVELGVKPFVEFTNVCREYRCMLRVNP